MTITNQTPVYPGWQTVKAIGNGSYGTVYEIQRDVYGNTEKAALKVITLPFSDSEVDYLRSSGMDDEKISRTIHAQVGSIANEYKLMSQIRDCPNVVHCDDFLERKHQDAIGWDIYIKMELLTPLLKRTDLISNEQQIINLGKDLCRALIACQEHSILHRDIKPQNIFISPKGEFKLGDFGIARNIDRTTNATVGMGTYSYMAPEVARGQAYGRTADIYSLGLVLYWCLNNRQGPFLSPGRIPTHEDNENAKNRRFAGEPLPAPANGSGTLKQIVLKACAYDPRARYQSAAELLADLEALTQQSIFSDRTIRVRPIHEHIHINNSSSTPAQAPITSSSAKKGHSKKSFILPIILIALIVIVISILIIWGSIQNSQTHSTDNTNKDPHNSSDPQETAPSTDTPGEFTADLQKPSLDETYWCWTIPDNYEKCAVLFHKDGFMEFYGCSSNLYNMKTYSYDDTTCILTIDGIEYPWNNGQFISSDGSHSLTLDDTMQYAKINSRMTDSCGNATVGHWGYVPLADTWDRELIINSTCGNIVNFDLNYYRIYHFSNIQAVVKSDVETVATFNHTDPTNDVTIIGMLRFNLNETVTVEILKCTSNNIQTDNLSFDPIPLPNPKNEASIAFTHTYLPLQIGQTHTLYNGHIPQSLVIFTSYDPTIATIQNGKVTAIKSGNTMVKGTYREYEILCKIHCTTEPVSTPPTENKKAVAYIGIDGREVSTEEHNKGLPYGALVTNAVSGYPAQIAGITPGDVIINFGDNRIDSFQAILNIMPTIEIGKETTVTIYRNGQIIELPITPIERPST